MRHTAALGIKAKLCHVQQISTVGYDVTSPSGSTYYVRLQADGSLSCTCEWWANTHKPCTHLLAVEHYLAHQEDCALSLWPDKASAQRQHRAIRQLGPDLWATVRRTP